MTMNINDVLSRTAELLDLPDSLHEDAVMRYTSIAEWLSETGTELASYDPDIFPQGSFRLGTAIRPILHEDEYDIDLVCHLNLKKEHVTQADLKKMVGDRLKKDPELADIIKPSRRCWTLNFPKRFHMDVLPAIPNVDLPPTGILLTDQKLVHWQHSNPIAYANWFRDRMKVRFQERRLSLANSLKKASIEEVPEWQVRTPLQRAVQLLKRHRDFFFQAQPDDKPVSIIITTLAAHAYNNQESLSDALGEIVRDMPRFIVTRDGKWIIENPVDQKENFADKWNEDPAREQHFRRWLARAQQDFMAAARQRDFREVTNSLSLVLGRGTMEKVASSLGLEKSNLPIVAAPTAIVPAIAAAPHCQNPPWLERLLYTATISPTLHMNRNSPRTLWPFNSRPIPKKTWIKFKANTNVPAPYKIQWQVVNTGEEAHSAQQPRGDFYDSEHPENVRWESVAYAGTHWVEAFVIKEGACVARSGRTYVRVRK